MTTISKRLLKFMSVAAIGIGLMAPAAMAQDFLQVGNTTCTTGTAGSTVTIPVFIRDIAGTPLGVDRTTANRISGISFNVTPTNPSAIAVDGTGKLQVTVAAAGVTTGITPTFSNVPRTGTTFGYIVTYDVATPIPFTSNAASPGDLVANVTITLAATAAPGTRIDLVVNPSNAVTSLVNADSSISETTTNGGLSVVSGCIQIPALSVALSPTNPAVPVGGTTTETVTIGAAQATTTTVTLTSSNPAAATVPANVTIPAGATSATFSITGVAPGTSTITATLPAGVGGSSATATATVSANPTISFTPPAPTIPSGSTATETVTISAAQGTPTTVTLASSNTAVATVPASVTIPAGSTTATFGITGVAAGTATITGTLPAANGGGTATATATVTAPNPTISLAPTSPIVTVGNPTTETVTISAVQATPTTITLSSSNPAVATVPASVIIPAGSTSATFSITGVSAGTSTIRATLPAALGSGTATATANVFASGSSVPTISGLGFLLMACLLSIAGVLVVKH